MASLQIGTIASYYAQAYYHGGECELAATWFSRQSQFGLADGGPVDAATFERLHAGIDPQARSLLTTRGREVEGLDLCFSPGKSVSLAYALTNDKALREAILEAHHRAVRAALIILEGEAIYTRRGRGGMRREKVALTAALFTHDTARPERHLDDAIFADPQIHTHAVLLNLCVRCDRTIGTIDTRLGPWKLTAGAIYHAHLAAGLHALGFSITEVGANGTFELAGIPRELRAYFSTRRDSVVDALQANGTISGVDPRAAAQAALQTRRAKQDGAAGENRFALWQTKARSFGFEPAQVLSALERHQETAQDRTDAIETRIAALPDALTETEVAFPRRELLRQVAAIHVGTAANPNDLVTRTDRLVEHDLVRQVRRSALDEPVYSTPEMIKVEACVQALASELGARRWWGLDQSRLDRAANQADLSDEQHAAVQALAEPTALALLEGRAGTGKTQALRSLVGELQAQGFRVIAAAQAWRTARMLEDDLGVEAKAVDAWLSGATSGQAFVDERTVLLVDEAGQLGSRTMLALLEAVQSQASPPQGNASGAKLILIGDRGQLQPIAAGAGLVIVGQSIEGASLTQVRRQRTPALRQAVEHLSLGAVVEAWGALNASGAIGHVQGARATVVAAVDTWEVERRSTPEAEHLLLARTNGSVHALNAEVRRRRRERGEFAGDDVTIQAATPSGHAYALPLAPGDRLRFGTRVDRFGIVNGTTGVVESVEAEENGHAQLQARIGDRCITFSTRDVVDRRGHVRLAHDYATTVFSSQGLTAESCTVLVEPSFDRHDIYVAASRSRGATHLLVDEGALDLLARSERRVDAAHGPITPQEREAALLRRLSRERVKDTTLTLDQDGENDELASPQPRRVRQRDFNYEL